MSNLLVGKRILKVLSSNLELMREVGTKIFPLIANDKTTYPFIVYKRSGFIPASTKDYTEEQSLVDILVVSDKYKESINIGEIVIETLRLDNIKLEDSSEEYIDNAFLLELKFRVYGESKN